MAANPPEALVDMDAHSFVPPMGSLVSYASPLESTATQKLSDGQETEPKGFESMCTTDHDGAPSKGSVESAALPCPSTATQRVESGQEMSFKLFIASASTVAHGPCPGVVEVMTSPCPSTVAQDPTLKQTMVLRSARVEPPTGDHAEVGSAGSTEARSSPEPSATTHKEASLQLTDRRSFGVTFVVIQEGEPLKGSVELSTSPLPSTAIQKFSVGHAMSKSPPLSATVVTDHADVPPAGLADVSTWFAVSIAAQTWLVGQEKACKAAPPVSDPKGTTIHEPGARVAEADVDGVERTPDGWLGVVVVPHDADATAAATDSKKRLRMIAES